MAAEIGITAEITGVEGVGRMTAGTEAGITMIVAITTIAGIARCAFARRAQKLSIRSRRISLKHQSHESAGRRWAVAGVILLSSIGMMSVPSRTWAADAASGQAADTVQGKPAAGVNGLIAHLHEELKITPTQESLFQKLADVMREDAETMRTLAKKRAADANTMTAVEDLKSYADISEAHAEGTKKMITAFEPLYDSMSDDQKKTADQEFREHYASHHHGKS